MQFHYQEPISGQLQLSFSSLEYRMMISGFPAGGMKIWLACLGEVVFLGSLDYMVINLSVSSYLFHHWWKIQILLNDLSLFFSSYWYASRVGYSGSTYWCLGWWWVSSIFVSDAFVWSFPFSFSIELFICLSFLFGLQVTFFNESLMDHQSVE